MNRSAKEIELFIKVARIAKSIDDLMATNNAISDHSLLNQFAHAIIDLSYAEKERLLNIESPPREILELIGRKFTHYEFLEKISELFKQFDPVTVISFDNDDNEIIHRVSDTTTHSASLSELDIYKVLVFTCRNWPSDMLGMFTFQNLRENGGRLLLESIQD